MATVTTLPSIPSKRYFTIGEVSELCGVKPHVLRYWEQEFSQLRPIKRRGNRRYYQHHEVLLVRRIRDLLYEQGFTISGARQQLVSNPKNQETMERVFDPQLAVGESDETIVFTQEDVPLLLAEQEIYQEVNIESSPYFLDGWQELREELLSIRRILEED